MCSNTKNAQEGPLKSGACAALFTWWVWFREKRRHQQVSAARNSLLCAPFGLPQGQTRVQLDWSNQQVSSMFCKSGGNFDIYKWNTKTPNWTVTGNGARFYAESKMAGNRLGAAVKDWRKKLEPNTYRNSLRDQLIWKCTKPHSKNHGWNKAWRGAGNARHWMDGQRSSCFKIKLFLNKK